MKKRGRMTLQVEQDMIIEIMLKLPLKSVVRFKAVSKHWCNLITCSDFAKSHFSKHQDISSFTLEISNRSNPRISIINVKEAEETHSRGELFQPLTIPFPKLHFKRYCLHNCCDGILCASFIRSRHIHILLWNPITKWTQEIDYPHKRYDLNADLIGFGYDPSIKDYKLVRISSLRIEVMNLTSNAWRTARNVFSKRLFYGTVSNPPIYLNGNLYWNIVFQKSQDTIISFDLKKETLAIVQKPRGTENALYRLTSFRGKLCMVIHSWGISSYEIWWMKEKNNWDRVFDVNFPSNIHPPPLPVCGVHEAIIFGGLEPLFIVADSGKRERYKNIITRDKYFSIGPEYVGSLISPLNY